MDPENSDSQVQTGVATDPATASPAPASAATETIPQSPYDIAAAANAELVSRFNTPVPVAVEKTDEQAPKDPPPAEEIVPPTPTPEEQAQAAEAEEQSKGRFRLKGKDALIAAMAKEEGISIDDAADRYRGIAKTPPATIPGTEPAPAPSPVDTLTGEVARINGRLSEIETELSAKEESGDTFTDEYNKLIREQNKLTREYVDKKTDLKDAQRQVEQQGIAVQNTHEQIVSAQNANRAEAIKVYPSISDPESDLFAVTQAVVAEMQAANSPELSKPDAPMIVADAAAERLAKALEKSAGIPKATTLARIKAGAAPAPKVPPVPLSPPAPVVQQRRVTPAPGSLGQAPNTQPSTIGQLSASIATAEDPAKAGNDALLMVFGGPAKGRRPGS